MAIVVASSDVSAPGEQCLALASADVERWADIMDESRAASVEVPVSKSCEGAFLEDASAMVGYVDEEDEALSGADQYGESDSDGEQGEPMAGDTGGAPIMASDGRENLMPGVLGGELAGHLQSVGSRYHDNGRCKPCAFFHTKGCQSGAACLFCHLCPMHEKQRRKRLRRKLCHTLLSSYDGRDKMNYRMTDDSRSQGLRNSAARMSLRGQEHGFDRRGGRVPDLERPKAGHSRVNSGASTSASTCEGWGGNPDIGRFQHSRDWSTSTQESIAEHAQASGPAVYSYGHDPMAPSPLLSSAPSMIPPPPPPPAPPAQLMGREWLGAETPAPPQGMAPSPCAEYECSPLAHARSAYGSLPHRELSLQAALASPTAAQHRPPVLDPVTPFQMPISQHGVHPCHAPGHPPSPLAVSSPAGYVTCNGVQYALVPVSAGSAGASNCNWSPQLSDGNTAAPYCGQYEQEMWTANAGAMQQFPPVLRHM